MYITTYHALNINPRKAGSYDIVANTDLTSDVPLPYFNWVEYDFKNPPKPKVAHNTRHNFNLFPFRQQQLT